MDHAPYPWRDMGLLAATTLLLYYFLPTFAPSVVAGTSDLLLLGLILGIVVGLAVRVDARVAPVLAVAAFLGVSFRFLASGGSPSSTLPIAALIGLEVFTMAFLVRRTHAHRFEGPQDVLLLVSISLGVGLASGIIASGFLAISGDQADPFEHLFRSWVIDDAFGLLCIAPAFMTIHRPGSWSWRFAVEYGAVCAATAVIVTYIFRLVSPAEPGLVGWPYLVLLGPLWIAARLGIDAVTPVIAVVTWFAISSTADGHGAFAISELGPADRIVAVQLFCVVLAITLLLVATLRDARIRSMGRLKESSRLLREVVDGANALVYAKSYEADGGAVGRYVMVNRAWETVLGGSAAATLGHSDAELFARDLADAYLRADREVIDSTAPLVVEERGRSANGDLRYFSSAKFPLLSDDGHVWGVGGISTDTTDLVHALEREQRQAELLRAIFELSPTPAMRVTLGDDGSVIMLGVNSAMCALLAVEDAHVDECDLLAHAHEDDRATVMDVLEFARSASAA
jgi:integral membrane sensor domain MASE1